ncbi:MAG: hypothetical protein U9Q97_03755 [Acidobacteriota bacterium]|nr:hypothetical protein [Acidobacteriota bacterium]
MDSKTVLLAILAVVTAVVGFSIIDSMVGPMSYPQSVTNETVNTSTATPVNLAYDDLHDNSWSVYVSSDSTALTETTEYTIARATGLFTLVNGSYNETDLGVDYQYHTDEYFASSLSRTIMKYIVPIGLLGIFAIAIIF